MEAAELLFEMTAMGDAGDSVKEMVQKAKQLQARIYLRRRNGFRSCIVSVHGVLRAARPLLQVRCYSHGLRHVPSRQVNALAGAHVQMVSASCPLASGLQWQRSGPMSALPLIARGQAGRSGQALRCCMV